MKSEHQIFHEFSASVNTKWSSLNTHNFGSTWPILKKLVYLASGKEVLHVYRISQKSERVGCIFEIFWIS